MISSFHSQLRTIIQSVPEVNVGRGLTLSDAMSNIDDVIFNAVLAPVVLLVLKNLMGKEVAYWGSFIGCYFNRPFDVDGNPNTHDWVMIFNTASGEWECCSLTFNFGIRKQGAGAFIHRYDSKWNLLFIERISFGRWKQVGKGRLGDVSSIDGLKEKIANMEHGIY